MKVFSDITELQRALAGHTHERIALVPTMGCLHTGHASLMKKAQRLADIVVVSIYVNPLQFGANEDLSRYPKPFAHDLAVCEAEGVDYVFHPRNLYPDHGLQISLRVGELSQVLCGASRPGHFDGVVTVVSILFNIVRPHIAVFGAKDFQQLTIIRRMVADLIFPVEIIESETVRESSGLALSSRNQYLSADERLQAAALSQAMLRMQQAAKNGSDLDDILQIGHNHLSNNHIKPEYLQICSTITLQPLQHLDNPDIAQIFIAAPIGSARLIDNMPLLPNKAKEATLCN